MTQTVAIIGGGLSGSLLAIYLARQGLSVDLYERRSDLRRTNISVGRSINLAISVRGLHALEEVGLRDQVDDLMVPMYGRMVHDRHGELNEQPYGRSRAEHQNSISRGELNMLLLDAAESYANVRIHFQQRLSNIDFAQQQLHLYDEIEQREYKQDFSCVLATDGASSAVARSMQQQGFIQVDKQPQAHSYKELSIPVHLGEQLDRNYLHIWPRGDYMMIALPNCDGSFTCTLFLATQAPEGQASFAKLSDETQLRDFFSAAVC